MAAQFELKEPGGYRFNLKGGNGRTVLSTEL